MTNDLGPSSVRANPLDHLRRPIPLGYEPKSRAFTRRARGALALLGWAMLAIGALGAYATFSEWLGRGASRDTFTLMAVTALSVSMGAALQILSRRGASGSGAASEVRET